MNFLVKAAVIAAALGASAVASADQFDFTYTFTDGLQLTGSFDGTAGVDASNQLDATSISNLQVAFDGQAFTGGVSPTLILNAWNPGGTTTTTYNGVTTTSQGAWIAPSAATTLYANVAENNFGIADVDQSVDGNPTYFFNLVNAPAASQQAIAYNSSTGQFDYDAIPASWTLTDVGPSPVPVPGALPLLMSGLGLVGFARRRRAA